MSIEIPQLEARAAKAIAAGDMPGMAAEPKTGATQVTPAMPDGGGGATPLVPTATAGSGSHVGQDVNILGTVTVDTTGLATSAKQDTIITDLGTLHTDLGTTIHADLGTTIHGDLGTLHTDVGTTVHGDLGTLHTDLATTIHGDLGTLATDAHLTAMSAKLPAALGPATPATSLPTTGPARVARAVHMASAALPASGAYTSTTAYSIPDGIKYVTFYVTYTRGTTGGYAKFRCDIGNGTETAPLVTIDPTITASQPTAQQLTYQSELTGPQPSGAGAITWAYTFSVRGGATTIALQAAEVGATGTPGTCAITLTAD